MVEALIFAAGLGTRLRPFTDNHPKALLPLAGKPLLQWQIEKLQAAGISDIVINVHHFAEQIIDFVSENDSFGCHIVFSDERDELLDTGGGLLNAAALMRDADLILAMNADILSTIDIKSLLQAHHDEDLATLVVSSRSTSRYLLFDEANHLQGWTNRVTGEYRPAAAAERNDLQALAFSGMQVLSPSFVKRLADIAPMLGREGQEGKRIFSMIDAYLALMQDSTIAAFVPNDYKMMDVGKTEQLEVAERFAMLFKR